MARKLYSIAKLNQIAKEIEFDKQKALNLIMENGRKELQKYVKAYWYDAYSPSYYDRTYEFLNCVKARFINDDEVEIYYDTTAISSSFSGGGYWNIHASFDGSPFGGESFIETVEFGSGGGSDANPRKGYGTHGLQRLRAWLLSYVYKAVKQCFPV